MECVRVEVTLLIGRLDYTLNVAEGKKNNVYVRVEFLVCRHLFSS